MAKEYLSIEQVCEALGMDENQIKALVKEGRLREVRDSGKIFFKATEVEQIAGKEGSSIVDLKADDESSPAEINLDDSSTFASALSSLADSSATLGAIDESPIAESPPELEPNSSSGGSSIGFAFSDEEEASAKPTADGEPAGLQVEDIPEQLPAIPKASSDDQKKGKKSEQSSEIDLLPMDGEDSSSSLADLSPSAMEAALEGIPDLGLSGSSIISLEPSGDSSITDLPATKEGSKHGKAGISVFDDDELDVETDPMGETRISSGTDDFDAVGSGSGLLDLTQESDDTSLGAELLDVISPSDAAETETDSASLEAETITDDASAVSVMPEDAVEETLPSSAVAVAAHRTVALGAMPGAMTLNICLFLGLLGLAVLGLTTASVLQNTWPTKILGVISSGVVHYSVFGGLALVAIVTGVLSILAGRGK